MTNTNNPEGWGSEFDKVFPDQSNHNVFLEMTRRDIKSFIHKTRQDLVSEILGEIPDKCYTLTDTETGMTDLTGLKQSIKEKYGK